jgi:hypothetical protein
MTDKETTSTDEQSVLSSLVQMYESAEQSTADSRELCERDRDYKNGIQWSDEEIAALKKRKQPVITIDRIGPKIDFLMGMEAQHRTDPRAYPRTPKEEDGAQAATDALRYVMEDQRWDRVRSECFDNFLVEGSCGADVRVYEKRGEMCIEILPIMWDRMFGDPHSRMRNWSDGNFKGQFLWMDLEDAEIKYPGKEGALESTIASEASASGNTYEDVPRTRWADPKRKRVRIVEMWTKEEGKTFYTAFTKAGILERMESPYVNEDGEPDDGFVFGSCFIDRDGNRFGVVRRWISLQDEINKRRSKALHLMSVRQTFGNQLTGDKNKVRSELARPDGHVEMEGGAEFGKDFGVIPTSDMAAAQFQLLQEAKGEIDAVGVNAALSGNEQRNMSGRALIARSEQGLNELGPVFDNFKQFQHDVYRKVWNRIRQFWTAEKWVRVTDDEKNVKFVGLNQPMTLGEQLLDEMRAQGREITPEMDQQAKMDPAMQQIVGTKNNVAELDVDIVIDDVPASASLQGEQFEQLVQIAPQAAAMPPQLFEALIEASSLRNKEKIIAKLKGDEDKQNPQIMQMQQQMQEMQQALQEAQAAAADKSGDMQIKQMELELKSREIALKEAELELKAMEAQNAVPAEVEQAQGEIEAAKMELERQAVQLQHDREMFAKDVQIETLKLQSQAKDAQHAEDGIRDAVSDAQEVAAQEADAIQD